MNDEGCVSDIRKKYRNVSYWKGSKNKAVRWYFYCQRGLALFNEFRYLIMLIFGAYMLLKLDNWLWMLLMFSVSVPALVFFGWLQTHHMAKIMDWLGVEFASHWSRYGLAMSERSLDMAEENYTNIKKMAKILEDYEQNPKECKSGG